MRPRRVRFEYDRDADAAYIALRRGKVAASEEVEPGLVVDLDKQQGILGVEILRFSQRFMVKARNGSRNGKRVAG